ncbi:MAG: ribbon-helix-helix domain-containing protein [Alphaproteobacteria bacterium]|nr:ribbon-helix-helix domain-containing protein [Alphaproteobacteria bacterium]
MQKRSFTLDGHQTSIALEAEFWQALERIANARQSSLPALIAKIDRQRSGKNLASALRVHALETTR